MNESERDALLGKVQLLERQLAQAIRKEIDIERDSQDALAEAEEFRSAAQYRERGLHAQLAQAKVQQDTLSQELDATKLAASTLQASSGEHDQALQQKQTEVFAAQDKNRHLDQKVEQLQSFLQEQAASNKQARASIMELTRERGELDMRAMRAENQLRQCQHSKQNAELGSDMLQKDVASLQQQLAGKSEAIRTHWTESNAKVNDLERQLRVASNQLQLLETSHQQLQQQRDRISDELRQAQQKDQETQAHLQQRQALFEEESNSLHTALSRHKEERASLEHDKQSLHSFVQELTRKAEAFNVEHEQTVGQLQQQLSAAKQGLVERDEIIQRFKEVTAADAMPPMTTAQHGSPSPHITAAQNGSSPVQAYSKYVALSHEHNKLQREHERLQADWEQFEQAVIPEAQKAKQLAKKNVDLDEANAKLSAQVQVSNEKAKRCMDSVHKWQGQFDDERGAHGVTRKLLKEAQHQVALLANENRQLNGIRKTALMPAWSSGLLDQSLVQFKDVQELVNANEHLRRTVHEQQLKAEQQLQQLKQEVQAREQQIVKGFEEPLASARQKTADALEQMEHLIQQRDDAQRAAREAQRPSTPSAAQQSPPQQQGHARELEQELSRLRQEGEAYRDDLKQQLEGAKQAAMQARHEAGQANAQATHEHSLVQQLQEDKRRMADIVDSWKRQGHEQQELISGLNKRLDQLQIHASRAQDEASSLRQHVATLSGQKELLQKENQRLQHESTEHSTARWQLVAQRNAEAGLLAQQHDQDAQDRAKLHANLNAAQKELAEVQRQLAEERSSHQHSFSSVQTVQEAADNRLKQVEQAKDKLQEALTEAHSQLAVTEAKAATLQTSLQQAEARVSALDQQRNPSGSGGGEAGEAAQAVMALRKELQEAQQQAAQEAGHVAQFKSLAEGAEETTSIVQAQCDALKAEAQQTAARLQQLESKLEAAERDLREARQSAYQAAQSATQDKQKAHSTITNLQAEVVIARRHSDANAERHQKAVQDLASRADELKQAQTSYNKSVLEHAETVKKLSEQEEKVQELQTERASLMASRNEGYTRKAEAELEWQQERLGLQDSRAAAQRRLQDVERVNNQLQAHLARQATSGQAPDQDSQLAGLVQHLTQRTRTLEGENTSFQQIMNRLKADVEASNMRVTEAQQARIQATEQMKDILRSQEDQQRLMQLVQERSLVQESNMSLRTLSERYRSEAEASSQQVRQLQAELNPLRRRINELQAAVESHQEENRLHDETIQYHQKRISDLLHKVDAVDKVEHERVTAALKAAQQQLASAQAEVAQLKPLRATVAQLTQQAEAAESVVASLQADRSNKQADIERNKTAVRIAKRFSEALSALNPEKLTSLELVSSIQRKQQEADELKQRYTALQQEQAKLIASSDQQKHELATKQGELTQAKQASTVAGASSKSAQDQHQAQLKTLQKSEQALQAQLKALNQEMQQKSNRLEDAAQQQRQVQEQLAKANAELKASSEQQEQANRQLASLRMQLETVSIDLSAKSAQLETAVKSMQAAQAQARLPNAGQEQQASAEQQHSLELVQKELQLQQAQAALQQQQSQLTHQQQQLQQQQLQYQERQQLLQQQQEALATAQQDLQKREADVQARLEVTEREGAAAEGPSIAELQQECQQLRSRVAELEKVVAASQSRIAELEDFITTYQAAAQKAEAAFTDTKRKLQQASHNFRMAHCTALAKQEVQSALQDHIKGLVGQLTEAGLPVPGEVDAKGLYQFHLDRIKAERAASEKAQASKRPAADAKPAKQTSGGGAVQRARAAVQPGGTAASATPKEGPPAEVLAVRHAALASLHKAQEGSPDATASTSPRRPHGGGKRERAQGQPAGDSSATGQTTAGGDAAAVQADLPAAKRAKADEATVGTALALSAQPEVATISAPAGLPLAARPAPSPLPPSLPVTSAPASTIPAPDFATSSVPQPSVQPEGTAAPVTTVVEASNQQQPQAMDTTAPEPSVELDPLAPAFVPAMTEPTAQLDVPAISQNPVAKVVNAQHDQVQVNVEHIPTAPPHADSTSAPNTGADASVPVASGSGAAPLLASLQQQTSVVTAQAALTSAPAQVPPEPVDTIMLASAGENLLSEEGQVADEEAGADAGEGPSDEDQTEAAGTDGEAGAGAGQKRAPIVWKSPAAPETDNQGPPASGQQQQQQAPPGARGQRGRSGGAAGRGGTAAGNSVRNAARSTYRGKGAGRGPH